MAGEVEPFRRPAEAARRIEIEDRQRHGQAAPALDHADQIGVLQIVVVLVVAAKAVALDQNLMQRADAGEQALIAFAGRSLGELGRHQGQMLAAGVERRIGMIEARQQQRRLGEIDLAVAALAEGGQPGEAGRPLVLCSAAHGGAAGWAAVRLPAAGAGFDGCGFAGWGLAGLAGSLMRT